LSEDQNSRRARELKKFREAMTTAAGRFELYKRMAELAKGSQPLTEAELVALRQRAEEYRPPTEAERQAAEREGERLIDQFVQTNQARIRIEQREAQIEAQQAHTRAQERTNELLERLLNTPGASPGAHHPATGREKRTEPTDDDRNACIRWSAAQSDDGKTSRDQLREDALKWCKVHGVIYGKHDNWYEHLRDKLSELRRRGKKSAKSMIADGKFRKPAASRS
jgi:hypothetical protein